MFRRAAAPLFALLLAALLSAVSFADSNAFLVGILRADGIVIPFAAFEGGQWREAWAVPEKDPDVPVNVASVPKGWWGPVRQAETWQAWIAGEGAPRTLHVKQPDVVPANCLRQVGLRTEYRSPEPLPPITDHPYPKDGLVVFPPQPVEAIETLPKRAPEWQEFAPIVTGAFNKAERSLFDNSEVALPLPTKQRESMPPVIESIYAYGQNPRTYAVELRRTYFTFVNGRDACQGLTFGRAWLQRSASGRLDVVSAEASRERCDREDNLFMLPLGVMHAGSRVFWIAQLAGWDEEHYAVVEILPKAVKLLMYRFGGWC